MITRLQNLLLKHNRWLFSGLLIVVIVAFVLTIGNQGFSNRDESMTRESREYFGYDLNNPKDSEKAYTHASVSAQINPDLRISPRNPAVLQQYMIMRISALGLANEVGIAEPTREQLEAFIQTREAFKDRSTEEFSADQYTSFRDYMDAQIEDGGQTLSLVLKEDYRIEKIRDLLGGPGFVLPSEVSLEYLENNTKWNVSHAKFNYSEFNPELDPSEETLTEFFESNKGRYELPERIRIKAIQFNSASYLDQVTGGMDEVALESYFGRYKYKYKKPPPPPSPDGEPAETPEEVTLDDVRDQVVNDMKKDNARQVAREQSNEFLVYIYENNIARDSDEFAAALEQYHATTVEIEPYSRDNTPSDRDLPRDLLNSMWIYSSGDRYYSDPGETAEGAVVLIFEELLPAREQGYEEVADQIKADWLAEERRTLFAEKAQELEATVNEAMASGTEFKESVEKAGFSLAEDASFDGSAPPSPLLRLQLWSAIRKLETGQTTPVAITSDAAAIAYINSKTSPESSETGDEIASLTTTLTEDRAESAGWSALASWASDTFNLVVEEPETASE